MESRQVETFYANNQLKYYKKEKSIKLLNGKKNHKIVKKLQKKPVY